MVYPVKSPTIEGQLYLEDQPRESLLGSATSGWWFESTPLKNETSSVGIIFPNIWKSCFFLVGSATYMWYTGWWCNNRNHLEKYEFVNGKDEIPYIMENNFCLVVWTLWKIWVRQLGWWFSIYGNIKKSSKPPTRSGLIPMTSPFSNGFPMVFLWNGDLWFFNMFWSHLT